MASRLTDQQLTQARALRQQGYSIRDIADQLGVPKSRIEWALSQPSATPNALPGQLAPTDRGDEAVAQERQQIEQERQQLDTERQTLNEKAQILAQQEQQLLSRTNSYAVTTRQHTQQLQDLAQRQQAFAQERQAFEQRQQEFQRELSAMPRQEETYERYRLRANQEKMVSRYNRLVQELLNNSSDTRWTGDEVDEYLERLETLKKKVVSFCDANQIDERRLLLFQGIEYLIKEVEEEQDEQTSGIFSNSSVTFDYGDQYQEKISAYIVQSFEQLTPTTSPGSSPATVPTGLDDDDDWDDDDDV